jgi:fatty acid desaturase
LYSYTWFRLFHLQHHRYVNSGRDAEDYKNDLDTSWKRFLFLTAPGVKLVMARKFRSRPVVGPDQSALSPSAEDAARIRTERLLIRMFWYGILVGAYFSRSVLFGYLIPLMVVTPIVSSIRIILEHGEVNPDNVFHNSTYYRLGPLLRFLLPAQGDTHLMHHLYPGIPIYNLKRSAVLSHDCLIRNGVVERPSLFKILWGWFIENQPHRRMWTHATQSAEAASPKLPADHQVDAA